MKFDYAIGKRVVDFTSQAAKDAGCAKGQWNEAQCATSVSLFGFFHGFSGATVLGNANQRYANAKAQGYKVGNAVKSWSWACFGTGTYGHIIAVYEVSNGYAIIAEANANGDSKLSDDDMVLKKVTVSSLAGRSGYQGCIYLADTFPKVTPKNLDYHYSLTGSKTKLTNASSNNASATAYTVVSGDTLTSIAKKFSTTVTVLKNLNGIANANVIKVGQVLKLPSNAPIYSKGKVYTTNVDLKVREGAGTANKQKLYTQLTSDGKKNARNETYAVLKSGTKITVQEVKTINSDDIWLRIPSGWIAAYFENKQYVK